MRPSRRTSVNKRNSARRFNSKGRSMKKINNATLMRGGIRL